MKRSLTLRIFLLIACLVGQLASIPNLTRPLAAATPEMVVDAFETATLPAGQDGNGIPIGFFTAQDSGSTVAFSTTNAPPAPVPGLPTPNSVLKMDFNVAAYGVVIHGFENNAVNQWITQDWSSYEGFGLWVYGNNSGVDLFIDVIDNRNNPPKTTDDAERYTITFKDNFSGWQHLQFPFSSFVRKEIGNGAPNDGFTLTEVHGWAFGTLATNGPKTFYADQATVYGTAPVHPLTVGFATSSTDVKEGRTGVVTVKLSKAATSPVTVKYTTADGTAKANRDYTPSSGALTFAPGVTQQTFSVSTLEDSKYEGDESVLLQLTDPSTATLGVPAVARLNIQDNDPYDATLLDDFELPPYQFKSGDRTLLASTEIAAGTPLARPGQGAYEQVIQVTRKGNGRPGLAFQRTFAASQDWRDNQGLSFWFYGNNTGSKITVNLQDNRTPDPGPIGWKLVWSDEFNSRAGTLPNPMNWGYEIGDGTVNGIPGWGNAELEYYTNSPDNAATDGRGNLAITAKSANGALTCYYGPCQYTSARLLTKNKFDLAYGRIEARVKVPRGAGLWPAFWSLGSDIDRVSWPQSGEIDIMENVGRLPNRVFGTIHGPGYSGAQSFGRTYDLSAPVADAFHTFALEWQPNALRWYIDGIQYHTASPADVAPNQWVFNHPFFLLLNVAIGGNFGGAVGADTVFPQTMLVDYVRLYQPTNSAERFATAFKDNFTGWKRITIPFSAFKRSHIQPKGAPNDGLTLASVWGYGVELPSGYTGRNILFDQVKLQPNCSYNVIVTSTADSGAGSLRQAINDVCFDGTIGFAPSLAGQTIGLTSTELTLKKPMVIDGAGAPGLTISGTDAVRPFVIDPTMTVTLRNFKITHGYGFQLAGGILNNGTLTLDHVAVTNNKVTTNGEEYWKGGAGIYSGDGSTLTLLDSTVADNTATAANGGGVLAFFHTFVTINRSTISGNSANVGGGLRTLGDVQMLNSTISGNSTYGWMGGAFFHTDGVMNVSNSTIANNTAPAGASGGAFVGTFTDANATLTLANTLLAGNSQSQCFYAPYGAGVVTFTSRGHNLATDATCGVPAPAASDLIVGDAKIGPLASNGGPTLTHLLQVGSPALDAADAASCPTTDQRGGVRPQGSACDIGAVEGTSSVTAATPLDNVGAANANDAVETEIADVDPADAVALDLADEDAPVTADEPQAIMQIFLPLVER
ncbi:MAG: family 16 glycosylhydrolase [Caldilineaceae bacterium]